MDGLGKNNLVDIIKEEPKNGNIFVKEDNREVGEYNNVITFSKREDMKNEDKVLRETGSTFEMLGHQQPINETTIEKGIIKTEDTSIMDYEEGISCFVVTAAAEFHVVSFRQNKKNYPCIETVEEIKEHFECEANEDVLQENKSAFCENIIEMKNDDTDKEEEMKAVIMIVDDEDLTEKLENKEIKKESISNYNSCNASVEEIKDLFEYEANEDVLQENKSAFCENIIEMKNNDTDNEEEMKTVIMIVDDEDLTEKLENKKIKKESISNYDSCNAAVEEIKDNFECEANEDVLQENKSAACENIIEMKNDDTDKEEEMKAVIMIVDDEDLTEKLENKEIKKESISYYNSCNAAVEEIKELFEYEANEDVLQENKSAFCENIIEMKNNDTDNEEEMKTVIMIVDDEDLTEKLENKKIKKESISNYDSCNAAVEEIKDHFECEANEDVLQENKSAFCENIIEMKNNDTDNEEEMKTVIMIVDDEDLTEKLENKKIKKESISNYDSCNAAVEEIKDHFECEANEDVLQENKSAFCENIIEMKNNNDTDNEEEMKTVIMIVDDEDLTEKLENKKIKKESISNYDSCNAAVEEIKEHFECEANEDVLQENKSAACENIIEMKNDDTDNEEEMKTVIMIVDDEDEENTPLSTLNSSTGKLKNKEIKKKSISNYDSCNATVEEIKENFEFEANEDVLQENKSAVCEDIIEIKNNDTDNEEEMKAVIIIDDEYEENTPLSTLNSSTEKLENKQIKKESISNYDSCNAAVDEIKEHFECVANEDVPQENKSAVCENIIEIKNNDKDNEEEMKDVIIIDDEYEENTPLSTLNSSTEKLKNKEIKKKSIANYNFCNAADTETSSFEGIRYEPGYCRKIDIRRIYFLKTLQDYHNLQKPKPNNSKTKRKVWSDLCCPLSKQSYKHLKSLETDMKGHGKCNLQEKEDEEKIPLSTPKPFSSEKLQKNETKKDKDEEKIPLSTPKPFSSEKFQKIETKKDKEDEGKIPLSTPKPFSIERLQKKDNISDNDSCNAADIDQIGGALMCPLCKSSYTNPKSLENHMKKIHDKWDCQVEEDKEKTRLSTPKSSSTERLENKEIKEDKMSIDISTHFERVHNETGRCPEVDTRSNFLESLKNYHDSNKPKTNDPKIWRGFCCVSCKRSYKSRKSLENHIRSHGKLVIFNIEPDGDLTLKSPKSRCFGQYFKTKEEADNHYNRSVHSEINKCPTCYKIYTDPDKLEAHKRYCHKQNIQIPTKKNDDEFSVCKICGNIFPNETALSDHEKSGCATSPIFKCDECDKIFRSAISFKRHRTVHTGELPHLCNLCGKAFRAYKIAKRHEREHFKGELFECSICPFVFADKKSLITHFGLHTA